MQSTMSTSAPKSQAPIRTANFTAAPAWGRSWRTARHAAHAACQIADRQRLRAASTPVRGRGGSHDNALRATAAALDAGRRDKMIYNVVQPRWIS